MDCSYQSHYGLLRIERVVSDCVSDDYSLTDVYNIIVEQHVVIVPIAGELSVFNYSVSVSVLNHLCATTMLLECEHPSWW